MNKRLVFLLATSALLASAVAYTLHTASSTGAPADAGQVRLAPGQIIFRNMRNGPGFGYVAAVSQDTPAGPRTISPLVCERVSATAGAGVCLATKTGGLTGFSATLLDRSLAQRRQIAALGVPTRARIAADGSLVAWTAFVTGHSYAVAGFSTRTSILDNNTGKYYGDIETLRVFHDGQRIRAPDLNIWGVTFTPDKRRFYASISTGGKTHLIEADIASWKAQTLLENAECPSLSPDGTWLAFKRRIPGDDARPWRLAVLELSSRQQTDLLGTEGIDDQAVWLDGRTIIYSLERNIWAVPADGSGAPRLLIADAESPSAL